MDPIDEFKQKMFGIFQMLSESKDPARALAESKEPRIVEEMPRSQLAQDVREHMMSPDVSLPKFEQLEHAPAKSPVDIRVAQIMGAPRLAPIGTFRSVFGDQFEAQRGRRPNTGEIREGYDQYKQAWYAQHPRR